MACEGRFDRFVVTDAAGIEKLVMILHDEFFAVDEVVFDQTAGFLTIPFGRVFHMENERRTGQGFFSLEYEVPILRCVLRVSNVKTVHLKDTIEIGFYDINTITYDEANEDLVFDTCFPLELSAKVSSLHMEYWEEGFRGKALLRRGLFWDSGPKFVEW